MAKVAWIRTGQNETPQETFKNYTRRFLHYFGFLRFLKKSDCHKIKATIKTADFTFKPFPNK